MKKLFLILAVFSLFSCQKKEEEKKVFTPKPRPSTEIKSPIKKSYEETKHVSSTSKDSEFGSTFNNAKSDSDGFESF